MPLPSVEETDDGVMAIIQRKTVEDVIATNNSNVGNKVKTKLTERQIFILAAIKANPHITGKALSETLSVTQRTIERDLAMLQKADAIRHEGKVNSGFWVALEKNH